MTAIARPVYRRGELTRLLHPASISVIGASTRAGSFGQRVLLNLKDYDGRIYPVNARYDRIGDHQCYPNIGALPESVDCAVIAAPREAVGGLVEECAAAGTGGMIVFASGYAELGRPERIAEQDHLARLAHSAGVPLIGPNCIGILNCIRHAPMTFMAIVPPPEVRQSAIGLISQSGALGFALAQAAARGVSFSHVLTSGNSCDVDMADYVAYLAEEPACRAIACVFEGMAQPRRLLEAARIAWQADKPLVVFKMATGEQGATAAISHTGSLAGSHEAYRAAFRREGVILVEHYESLIETAAFFAKAPAPTAQGVAILATSGGAGIMAADRAEQHGVALPQPDPRTQAILERHIPEFGSTRNPCDVTAQVLNDPASLSACATAVLEQPDYAAIVAPQVYAYQPVVDRIAFYDEIAHRAGKPICSVWVTEDLAGPGARETELCPHVALFRSVDNCFATLAAWQRRAARRETPEERVARLAPEDARTEAARLIRASSSRALTERESKPVLALYGLPVVDECLTQTAEEAAEAAERLGYPVVLKAESPDLPHKTEAGVIRLNLRDGSDVRQAHAAIMQKAAAVSPPPRISGVLVQAMVPKGVEVVVGARVDPLFGPLIVVGLGGILIELLRDTVLAPAPVGRREALELLRSLKGFPLLQGFRNLAPVNLDRLTDVVCRISEFATDQSDLVAELDVNPLICAGDRITAVDALIVRTGL